MNEVNASDHERAKWQAYEIYSRNKKISCPVLSWTVKITPDWLGHIEWKRKNHKRDTRESFVRYICFKHVPKILQDSWTYQEYRETYETVEIERKWRKVKERKLVKHYGFVSIVNWNKNRVKVIVRQVDGWACEFASVIPAWKSAWYTDVDFFDEDDNSAYAEENIKKVIQDDLDDRFMEVCTESV